LLFSLLTNGGKTLERPQSMSCFEPWTAPLSRTLPRRGDGMRNNITASDMPDFATRLLRQKEEFARQANIAETARTFLSG